jgi:hypothetical protein
MEINVRHLAATPVGRTVRVQSRVAQVDAKGAVRGRSLGWPHKIGDGTHRRGVINVAAFEAVRRDLIRCIRPPKSRAFLIVAAANEARFPAVIQDVR